MTHTTNGAPISPLDKRGIEIEIADAFLAELRAEFGSVRANAILTRVVDRLAEDSAASFREHIPDPGLADLWEVWRLLGGEGRLDLQLDELTDTTLRFHVDRCSYAELYRSRGLQEIGVAFSCRRDAPFARALVPGVDVEQSTTILEGALRCEFTYTLEGR